MKRIGGKTFCFDFYFCLILILLTAAEFFICPKMVFADENIIINEIMYNPEGSDTNREWIEIYNPTKNKIEIKKVDFGIVDEEKPSLGKDGIHFLGCHEIDKDLNIESGKFAILTNSKDGLASDYPGNDFSVYKMSFSLPNSKGYIKISNDSCKTFFSENNYDGSLAKEGYSLENENDIFKQSYVAGGTPGEKNSEKPAPKEYSDKIRINEILPHPKSGESEYIELYNFGDNQEDLAGWILEDAAKTKCELSGEILSKSFYVPKNCGIRLNDTGGETLTLYNPENVNVSLIQYSVSAKENISYSFDGFGWRWSSKLTPENENEFDEVPGIKIKKDDKIYKNIYANFEVKTGDENQKVTWDFGDGGSKSYLQKTRHKYLKTGTYQVILTVKGKSDDFVENFEVEVNKFKESKLKIVKVKANPKGKDAKLESITIKNNSKKKINLKNWSIATGWENLYNHPISKELIIKPGESKEITKKYSAFTLNNKQTKIELRRPDGSVESKIKYSKKEGVEDDETYEKTDNGWEWNTPIDAKDMQDNIDSTQTSVNATSTSMENAPADAEAMAGKQNNAEENTDNNQVEDNSEVQPDEPIESGEVLGIETINENIVGNDNDGNGLFMTILLNTNQKINNLINFMFDYF